MSQRNSKPTWENPPNQPNPLHVQWLLRGKEQWNNRRRARAFRPELGGIRLSHIFRSEGLIDDYENANLSGYNLRDADLAYADLCWVDLRDSNLVRADLRWAGAGFADFPRCLLGDANLENSIMPGAKFNGIQAGGAKMRSAEFNYADFTDACLRSCDLRGASMVACQLRGASLVNANVCGANLFRADMVGCDTSGARIWKAGLFSQYPPPYDLDPSVREQPDLPVDRIESLEDLIRVQRHLRGLTPYDEHSIFAPVEYPIDAEEATVYFRGEACDGWTLSPSAMRMGFQEFESEALTAMQTQRPDDFAGLTAAIDQMALARHFGLPTRILDVTRNPLVALFWAAEPRSLSDGCHFCKSKAWDVGCGTCDSDRADCTGVIHVFVVPNRSICAYDSDRVSIVANFAKLSRADQNRLLSKTMNDTVGDVCPDAEDVGKPISFRYKTIMTRLVHFIGREKPYFADAIDVRDLFRVLVVEPKRDFERLRVQSGAFMMSAFHDRFERDEVMERSAGQEVYWHYTLSVPPEAKETLHKELSWMDVTRQTLYGDVETVAESIRDRFQQRLDQRD